MIINEKLLLDYGATYQSYKKNDFIFCEGHFPYFYFQIAYGIVVLKNVSQTNDVTFRTYSTGECCGEYFLFCQKKYFVSAIATSDTMILQLRFKQFVKLLNDHPDQSICFIRYLSESLRG
jgi:CRP-like cAMP-binding protein